MLLTAVVFSVLIQGPAARDSLTLDAALARARAERGVIGSAGARLDAARAGRREAGTIPNPTASWSYTQDTPRQHVALAQSFDWLLTRGPARRATLAGISAAEADSAQAEGTLLADVATAYFGLLAADQRLTLAAGQTALADSLRQIAERRLDAGDIARLERDQVALDAARIRQELSRAREAQGAAVLALVRAIAWAEPELPPLDGSLDDGLDQPLAVALTPDALPVVRAVVADSLRLAALATQADRARVPMPSLEVGADWSDPSLPGETLGLIGVSLPLPLWNRGGAAVARARAEARQSTYTAAEVRREATQRLGELRLRLAESAARARTARDSLLPAAHDVRARATRAWQSGQTGVLPVLEALRAEREVAAGAIDELLAFQAVRADGWRLLGGGR